MTIRGTRSIFRSDVWLPNRGAITVVIDKAISPEIVGAQLETDKWSRAIVLRDATRESIQSHCGEPDLAKENS